MPDFIIMTDSTSDLPSDLAEELGVLVQSLKFRFGDKEYTNYLDGRELDPKLFYEKIKNGEQSTTSQVNPDEYVTRLTPLLKEGKDILILSFSSQLSGTFNSSRIASEQLLEEFPERKIIVIDTKSASLGEGLLVYLVVKEAEKNNDIDKTAAFAKELIPQIAHWFTVDDVGHLVRGGRVSKVAGMVAKMANVKPIMHTNDEGKLIPRYKAIGRKRAIKALFDEMVKSAKPIKQTVFIGHGDDLESANHLAKLIREHFELEKLVINMIGPVIGSHTGQGVLALFFIAEHR